MSLLKICKYGDPVLLQKSKPVDDLNDEIRKLIMDMLETMYAAPGVGLAANQVGVPVQLCVIDVQPEGKRRPLVLINPRVVSAKGKIEHEEGCLSLPGFAEKVKRAQEVRVEAVNEKGMPVVIEGKDLLAVALQHEIEHLEGKLFIDRLSFVKKALIKSEIRKAKKKGEW